MSGALHISREMIARSVGACLANACEQCDWRHEIFDCQLMKDLQKDMEGGGPNDGEYH